MLTRFATRERQVYSFIMLAIAFLVAVLGFYEIIRLIY